MSLVASCSLSPDMAELNGGEFDNGYSALPGRGPVSTPSFAGAIRFTDTAASTLPSAIANRCKKTTAI